MISEERKALKRAKKDHKDTIRLNPVGFQTERLKLQSHIVYVKSKSKSNGTYELTNETRLLVNEFEGKRQETKYFIDIYQGNTNLGYCCKVKLTA